MVIDIEPDLSGLKVFETRSFGGECVIPDRQVGQDEEPPGVGAYVTLDSSLNVGYDDFCLGNYWPDRSVAAPEIVPGLSWATAADTISNTIDRKRAMMRLCICSLLGTQK